MLQGDVKHFHFLQLILHLLGFGESYQCTVEMSPIPATHGREMSQSKAGPWARDMPRFCRNGLETLKAVSTKRNVSQALFSLFFNSSLIAFSISRLWRWTAASRFPQVVSLPPREPVPATKTPQEEKILQTRAGITRNPPEKSLAQHSHPFHKRLYKPTRADRCLCKRLLDAKSVLQIEQIC